MMKALPVIFILIIIAGVSAYIYLSQPQQNNFEEKYGKVSFQEMLDNHNEDQQGLQGAEAMPEEGPAEALDEQPPVGESPPKGEPPETKSKITESSGSSGGSSTSSTVSAAPPSQPPENAGGLEEQEPPEAGEGRNPVDMLIEYLLSDKSPEERDEILKQLEENKGKNPFDMMGI